MCCLYVLELGDLNLRRSEYFGHELIERVGHLLGQQSEDLLAHMAAFCSAQRNAQWPKPLPWQMAQVGAPVPYTLLCKWHSRLLDLYWHGVYLSTFLKVHECKVPILNSIELKVF